MLSNKNRADFQKAVESMKKFKRAEIKDDNEKSLIDALYTDLLPEQQVFKESFSDNTTFLVGRKGTGKSTVILKLESEYRKRGNYLPCYIDTKTVYESTKSEYQVPSYLKGRMPDAALEKYLIERAFIQSILKAIVKELDIKSDSFLIKIAEILRFSKTEKVKKSINNLKDRIDNNEYLKSIELPVINEYHKTIAGSDEAERGRSEQGGGGTSLGVGANGVSIEANSGFYLSSSDKVKQTESWEKKFSGALLKVFQIKDLIAEMKDILSELKIKKLVIFLDDFSEVDEKTLKNFVEVVLAPLNNWGEDFICFKVAAYPSRIFYGDIDKGKVDIIELDFYSLYANYPKGDVETLSLDFTKRLVKSRIELFTDKKMEDYFEVSSANSIDDYMELLFKCSMNVPRIIGYLLFYCNKTHISTGKKITRSAIEGAAKKYYEKVIISFFDITTNSLLSFNEKVSELQQRELLNIFVTQLKSIRKQITTGKLSGNSYQSENSNPYTSHFHFSPNLEKFVRTLELNFFLSKYSEMSDRDGKKVSVYCLNYGLALVENMRWGKPSGSASRKYFNERVFNFDNIFENFLKKSKNIQCIDLKCGQSYPYEKIAHFEFNKMRCIECHSAVEIKSISDAIEADLKKIDGTKLLPAIDLRILHELNSSKENMYAKDLSQELDISAQLISKRAKKLEEEKGLVHRERSKPLMKYSITDKGVAEYFNEN